MEHTPKVNLNIPGALAICRDQVGGSLHAAVLLYRIKHFFNPANNIKKLERFGKQWIAMPREKWAFEAGLTVGELKNAALPHLRKRDFVEIRQMRVSPKHPKTLWISLDLVKLNAANTPADLLPLFPPGEKPLGKEGQKAYPYAKS